MKRSLLLLPITALLFGCTPSPETPKDASPGEAHPAVGAAAGTPSPAKPTDASPQVLASGLQVYTANCAACHQVDGSGVPDIQPALTDNDIVAGDTTVLVRVVLQGPDSVLPHDRPAYSNKMPPFGRLTDQQIADVLTYIRHDFCHQTSAISSRQVQTIRTRFGP